MWCCTSATTCASTSDGGYGDGTALGRIPEPDRELLTLDDYRTRHAQYKRDPDLQALHAAHAMVPVWDDHESANDSWRDGAENHSPATEGSWAERKAAAIRRSTSRRRRGPIPSIPIAPGAAFALATWPNS